MSSSLSHKSVTSSTRAPSAFELSQIAAMLLGPVPTPLLLERKGSASWQNLMECSLEHARALLERAAHQRNIHIVSAYQLFDEDEKLSAAGLAKRFKHHGWPDLGTKPSVLKALKMLYDKFSLESETTEEYLNSQDRLAPVSQVPQLFNELQNLVRAMPGQDRLDPLIAELKEALEGVWEEPKAGARYVEATNDLKLYERILTVGFSGDPAEKIPWKPKKPAPAQVYVPGMIFYYAEQKLGIPFRTEKVELKAVDELRPFRVG